MGRGAQDTLNEQVLAGRTGGLRGDIEGVTLMTPEDPPDIGSLAHVRRLESYARARTGRFDVTVRLLETCACGHSYYDEHEENGGACTHSGCGCDKYIPVGTSFTDMKGNLAVKADMPPRGPLEDREIVIRGALAHECLHEEFTNPEAFRAMIDELEKMQRNKKEISADQIKTLWNILEDGMIENRERIEKPGSYRIIAARNKVWPKIPQHAEVVENEYKVLAPEGYIPTDADGNELEVETTPDGVRLVVIPKGSRMMVWGPRPYSLEDQAQTALFARALPQYEMGEVHPTVQKAMDECEPHIDAAIRGNTSDCIARAYAIHQILRKHKLLREDFTKEEREQMQQMQQALQQAMQQMRGEMGMEGPSAPQPGDGDGEEGQSGQQMTPMNGMPQGGGMPQSLQQQMGGGEGGGQSGEGQEGGGQQGQSGSQQPDGDQQDGGGSQGEQADGAEGDENGAAGGSGDDQKDGDQAGEDKGTSGGSGDQGDEQDGSGGGGGEEEDGGQKGAGADGKDSSDDGDGDEDGKSGGADGEDAGNDDNGDGADGDGQDEEGKGDSEKGDSDGDGQERGDVTSLTRSLNDPFHKHTGGGDTGGDGYDPNAPIPQSAIEKADRTGQGDVDGDELEQMRKDAKRDLESDKAQQRQDDMRNIRSGKIEADQWKFSDGSSAISQRTLASQVTRPALPNEQGELHAMGRQLGQRLKRIKSETRAPSRRRMTGRLDRRAYARGMAGDPKIYMRKGFNLDMDLEIDVSIDRSASISHQQSQDQYRMCKMLALAAKETKIPMGLFGWSGGGGFSGAEHYAFKERHSDDTRGIDALFQCGGLGTPTAEGIQFSRARLKKAKAKQKVMIVVTDGAANSIPEARAQVDKATKEGIEVIGLAFGCDKGQMDQQFGVGRWKDIDDFMEAPRIVGALIEKVAMQRAAGR